MKTDGSLWTWGYNSFGQLGNGTREYSTKPNKVMDDVVSVAANYYSSFAIKSDGGLWAWGENGSGYLGNGKIGSIMNEDGHTDIEHSTLPEKIMDDVVYITAGYSGCAAIKTDGSLWIWGDNGDFVQAAGIENADSSKPAKVMNGVTAVEISNGCVFVLKPDGGLWVWGKHSYNYLGYDINAPTKVMDNVAYICPDLAVKKDGSLWAMGGRPNEKGLSKIMDGMILN